MHITTTAIKVQIISIIQKVPFVVHHSWPAPPCPVTGPKQFSGTITHFCLFENFISVESCAIHCCVWRILLSIFLRFIHVTSISGSFFFVTNGIPVTGFTTVYLSIHFLVDTWIVSRFGLLWTKIRVEVLFFPSWLVEKTIFYTSNYFCSLYYWSFPVTD